MEVLLEAKGINQALESVGSHHTYQIRSLAIMVLHHIFKVFFIMYYPFLNQPPLFLCRDPNDPSLFYECTENNGGCVEQILSPNSPDSLVVDLQLYCEKAHVRTFASILFFLGGNIGSVYFASMSDKRGRKTAMFYSYLLGAVATFLVGTISINSAIYIAGLMLIRAGMSYHISLTLTYLAEISNEEFSRVGTLIIFLSNTAAEIGLVALAYFVTSWKVMVVFYIALPSLLVTILFAFLEETPVFLYSKKDTANTILVLNKIALINKRPPLHYIPSNSQKLPKTADSSPTLPNHRSLRTWNYVTIMLHPELRKRVLTFSLIKFYLYMAFYGCLFAISSLGGSIYANAAIIGFAEALGYCLAYKTRHLSAKLIVKRNFQIIVLFGISFLAIPVFSSKDGFFASHPFFLQGLLAFIIRTAICFVFSLICNLGNEVFPPEVRSQSVGIGEIFSVLGGLFSPIVILLADTYQINSVFLFAALSLIGLFSSYYLSDTPITNLEDEDEDEDIELKYIKMSN